ncbi:MAG: RnfABCDGE type electron transport complex subunit A [Peptoniphilaceae bacterium]|nr:RnfABCDGE type electron transport complex subunit A [Peptoniphilaceae bacterium]MDY6018585.1 RnfABCDGE type electron transport complex subunit A [Anaerococcus sp.]
MLSNLFSIAIASIFVNNYVLGQFLGICPTLGVTSKVETAKGMGFAVLFVITLSSIITWIVQTYILVPLKIEYLQTVVFILVIATLVQSIEMMMKKAMPNLYDGLGVYLPLITTNCVVLGVAIKNIQESYGLIETIVNSVGASVGFFIALVILASIREKMVTNDVPKAFEGAPLSLIILGIMSICFMGFAGL